jgi:hypothetical protein
MQANLDICQVKSGISTSRASDANRLKVHTATYAPFDPEEKVTLNTGKSKADRGFNHPVLGRLLIPIDLLGEYDEDRDRYVIHPQFRMLTYSFIGSLTESRAGSAM